MGQIDGPSEVITALKTSYSNSIRAEFLGWLKENLSGNGPA